MNKSTTKKSTKIAIRTVAIVLMCLLVALTSVGIYFATRKKEPSTPEVIVDPLEFATDKWDGETVDNSEFLSGDKLGNRGDHTYTINSASSFVYFIGLVNDENRAKEYNYFKDYTIYLNSNIDLSGYSIQSIGKKVTNDQDETISTFQGTFNGAYYSIMNADIVGNGLFGYVENANIQNVGLYNATINSTSDYTGSIVGEAVNTNISNVYARLGSVQGSTVGGIAGSFISNNGTHTISNSFVDNTLIGDKVGAIAGNVDTKTTSANAVTISYVYYTQQLDAINSFAFEGTAEENYVTLNNIINTNVSTDFSSWNYSSSYSIDADWCNYAYRENSTELSFNFPIQTGFAKVFLNGSYIEGTITIGDTTTDATTLSQAFNSVEANQEAEINLIVEKIFMDEEAVAKANTSLTITPDVNTTLVRSNSNSENLIVGSSNSKLYIGEETAPTNSSTITIDGNIDYVKSNNIQSGSLIYAQGDDLIIGSNVTLQNNINNTTGYGGAVYVYNINNDYNTETNTATTSVLNATITNCEATNNGGGICIIGSTIEINADISNCSAVNGGAVALIDDAEDNNDQQILTSTYLKYGGNRVSQLATTTITGTRTITGSYTNNTGSGYGGAFYISFSKSSSYDSAATVTFNGAIIRANTSVSGGGGVAIYSNANSSSARKTITFTGSTIRGNSTENEGGGINFRGSSASYITTNIRNTAIYDNEADYYGGALNLTNSSSISTVRFNITNMSSIYNNSARYGGGGVSTSYISAFYFGSSSDDTPLMYNNGNHNIVMNNSTGYIYGTMGETESYDAKSYGILANGSTCRLYFSEPTRSGYEFLHYENDGTAWTSGSKTYTSLNVPVWYSVWSYDSYTVTFNANGGEFDNGSSTMSKTIMYQDTYGGKNLYASGDTTDRTSGLTLSGNRFTLSTSSANTNNFFNFAMPYIDNDYFRPSSTYTLILQVSSYAAGASGTSVVLSSPGDVDYQTDITTNKVEIPVTGVKVYSKTFTTKSSFLDCNFLFRSYVYVPTRIAISLSFRIYVLYGDVDPDETSITTSTATASYGTTYGKLPTPTRDGYTFDGWYTSTSSSGTKVTATTTYTRTSDQTLYAHWDANSYTISFNANGGSVSQTSKTVTYGSTYGTLPTPTRNGYTFDGWYTSATGGTRITSSTTVSIAGNDTLYAHWTQSNYTVTQSINGSSSSESVGGYNAYIPDDVDDIASTVHHNGWYSSTSNISIYTDLIYEYFGGENMGTLPSATRFVYSGGSANTLTTSLGISGTTSQFTFILSGYIRSNYDFPIPFAIQTSSGTTKLGFDPNGTNGSLTLVINGNNAVTLTGFSTSSATPYSIVVICSNSTLRVYVNGTKKLTTGLSLSISSTDRLYLHTNGGYNYFNNAFFIPYAITNPKDFTSTFAAKTTTGNFLAFVRRSGKITSRYAVDIPTGNDLTYTGSSQTGVNSGTGYSRSGTYSATNAGTYTATVSLSSSNYVWSDGTTSNKSISWTIDKYSISPGSYSVTWTGASSYSRSLTYLSRTVTLYYYPYSTNAGTYTYTSASSTSSGQYRITLTNSNFQVISAGTFTINKRSVTIPTAISGLVYNGESQRGVSTGSYYTLSGTTTATNAGTYTAYATLSNTTNCQWSNGTTSRRTITWTISPYGLNAGRFIVAYTGNSSFSRYLTGVNGESVHLIYQSYSANAGSYDYSSAPISSGEYYIIIADDNYEIDSAGIFTIGRLSVAVPTAITGLVYNGEEQIGVSYNLTYYRIATGTTIQSDAGDYLAVFVMDNTNYKWSDGTTSKQKNIYWSIAPYALTVGARSAAWNGGNSFNITMSGVNNETVHLTINTYSSDVGSYTYSSTLSSGRYTISLTDDNYTIGSAGTFTITKGIVDIPTAIVGLEYNGEEQMGVEEGSYYTLTNNTATDADDYVATATLTDPTNSQWSDGTTVNKTISWSIGAYGLVAGSHSEIWSGSNSFERTISGVNNETINLTYYAYSGDVGNYTYTTSSSLSEGQYRISLTDSNYVIDSAGTFAIERASIDIPTAVEGLVYNGEEQTGVIGGDYFELTNNTGTNAGDYIATATIDDNHIWSDGTTEDKEIAWSIARAEINIPTANTGLIYDGEEKTGVNEGDYYSLSGHKQTNAGNYTAVASVDNNHIWSNGSTNDQLIDWSIAKAQVSVPTAVPNLVYDETEQTGVIDGAHFSLTNYTGTNAGNYTAIATLDDKNNFEWADGTTEDKQIAWSIAKADGSFTFNGSTITYDATNHTLTATNVVGGTIEYSTEENGTYSSVPPTFKNVGSHTIYARLVGDDNHNDASSKSATLVINPYELTIDAYTTAWTGASSYNRVVNGVGGESVTLTYTPSNTNAGTFTYQSGSNSFTLSLNSNNYEVGTAGNLVLESVEIEFTVNGYTGVYDGDPHGITINVKTPSTGYTITYSETLSGSYSETPITRTDAGETTVYFKINATNYTEATGSATIVISRAPIDAPTARTDLVYNGTLQTGVEANDEYYSIKNNTGTNANQYTATLTLKSNYAWRDNSTDTLRISWSIAKYGLNVGDYEVDWVSSASSYTRTVDGVNNEDVTLSYIPHSNSVGEYTYSTTAGADLYLINIENTNNYEITSAGTFTISPIGIVYNAEGYTGTYDEEGHSITVTVTTPDSGYTIYYSENESSGYTKANISKTDAGTYTIYFKIEADNYETATGSATIQINRKEIAIPSANTGLVYDETLKVGLSEGTGYTRDGDYQATNAGTYTAIAVLDKNYIWEDAKTENKKIKWTIERASIDYPTANEGLVYTGQSQVGVDPHPNSYYTIEGNTGINADDYVAIASLDNNHKWSDNSTADKEIPWSIAKKGLTVTADDKSMNYGDNAPSYTYSASGFVNNETNSVLSGSAVYTIKDDTSTISNVSTVDAGTYTIEISGLTSNNYEISFEDGTLTINKRNISACDIELSQYSYNFDATEHKPTVSLSIDGMAVDESNYEVTYSDNVYPGTATVTVTATEDSNLTGSDTVNFTINAVSYNIIYDTNGGNTIANGTYTIKTNEQTVITLTTPTRSGYSFAGYTIVTNSQNGDSTISGENLTTLTIPAKAYGDITVEAHWEVEITIDVVGNKTGNTFEIIGGSNTITTDGRLSVPEGSELTFNTTLIADDSSSSYQLFSIYIDDKLVRTVSSKNNENDHYQLSSEYAINQACTVKLEFKDANELTIITEEEYAIDTDINIEGVSDNNIYATDSEISITITLDTSSIATGPNAYIGFTYVMNGETHSLSYNSGDNNIKQDLDGTSGDVYAYTFTGDKGITEIHVLVREVVNVNINTTNQSVTALSLTSVDNFTRQIAINESDNYQLYVGEWKIEITTSGDADKKSVIESIFGKGNYHHDTETDTYYYIVKSQQSSI